MSSNLNILPNKKWHIWRKDNLKRLAEDEQLEKIHQEKQKQVQQEIESEQIYNNLKRKEGTNTINSNVKESNSNTPIRENKRERENEHFMLFSSFSDAQLKTMNKDERKTISKGIPMGGQLLSEENYKNKRKRKRNIEIQRKKIESKGKRFYNRTSRFDSLFSGDNEFVENDLSNIDIDNGRKKKKRKLNKSKTSKKKEKKRKRKKKKKSINELRKEREEREEKERLRKECILSQKKNIKKL